MSSQRHSGQDRVEHDWYVEEPAVTRALLAEERLCGRVWDPACGQGNIVRVCRDAGLDCVGSDLVERYDPTEADHRGHLFRPPLDLMNPPLEQIPTGIDCIVCNPPYSIWEDFLERCLALATLKVCFFLPLGRLTGETRKTTIYDRLPVSRVYVFSDRVYAPPGTKQDLPKANGSVLYMWLVCENGHKGPPATFWILGGPHR